MWSRSREVAAPADVVWELLTDVRRWPEWGPTVSDARLDVSRGSRLSPTASGRVRTPPGVWLPFVVTSWHDDGERRAWSWRVAGVPATAHEVVALDDAACRTRLLVPVWAPAYLPVVELALRRIQRLAEQDAEPTPDGRRA